MSREIGFLLTGIMIGILVFYLVLKISPKKNSELSDNFYMKWFYDDRVSIWLENCHRKVTDNGELFSNQYDCVSISVIEKEGICFNQSCISGVMYRTEEGWLVGEDRDG